MSNGERGGNSTHQPTSPCSGSAETFLLNDPLSSPVSHQRAILQSQVGKANLNEKGIFGEITAGKLFEQLISQKIWF